MNPSLKTALPAKKDLNDLKKATVKRLGESVNHAKEILHSSEVYKRESSVAGMVLPSSRRSPRGQK